MTWKEQLVDQPVQVGEIIYLSIFQSLCNVRDREIYISLYFFEFEVSLDVS